MPVTHSPGNPFAFSPAQLRKPNLTAEEDISFQHYRTPTPSNPNNTSTEELQRLEYRLKEQQERSAKEKVLNEVRIDELERRLLDEAKKMERTETDKRFLFDLQAKQAQDLAALRSELTATKTSSDQVIRDLRISNSKLNEELITTKESFHAERQALQREVDSVQGQLESQRRAMDSIRNDLTVKNDVLDAKNNKISELEGRIHSQAVAAPEGTVEELSFVTKELADSLSKITSLEIANAAQLAKIHRLQDNNAQLCIVSEEKISLENKIKLMEEMRNQLVEAQLRLTVLEREREVWANFVTGNDDLNVSEVLAAQKHEMGTVKSQLEQAEAQIKESHVLVESLRAEVQHLQDQANDAKLHLSNERNKRIRLERSKGLVSREVTFLREQLKSYDLEEQLENPNFDAIKSDRIKQLEQVVDDYRAQMEQAPEEEKPVLGSKRGREQETDFNEIERGEYLRKIRGLNAELEITKKEDSLLRKELEVLKAIEQKQIPAYRVLQHKENPTTKFQTIRTQTLKDLQTENTALLATLAGKGSVTVPIQSLRNAEAEIRKGEEATRQREKMIQRLKEVFAAKSSEFREAVYSLLGYKLDFLPNGRVKLTSMYAEATDHAFLFDGEAGTMQLTGGGNGAFMETVGNLIKFWSEEKNSIPGMLAALTMELLEKEGQS